MDGRSVFENLVSFIRDEIREFKKPINRDTLIEENLGVTGDDAADMILSYSKKFNVDISNFIFVKYFHDEPSVFLANRKLNALTVGDLEKAIIAGRLDEEVINS
ncbi:DUF1493 family protein [Flavihumibacter profundi]|uniref:DUF1493 family protein n=1 Tax=Flavihumibacter profundi TaxID=2716883 RepID=UPI001CC7A870|nr:DUF1493 family protein [Flavihumibacter profundi]MBZ5858547.1 DUF1493 family protein [Flavihumibacter profundi]MBZ5858560.1 DUF1493 family protein [Flavihumibacter profundi]